MDSATVSQISSRQISKLSIWVQALSFCYAAGISTYFMCAYFGFLTNPRGALNAITALVATGMLFGAIAAAGATTLLALVRLALSFAAERFIAQRRVGLFDLKLVFFWIVLALCMFGWTQTMNKPIAAPTNEVTSK